MHAGESLALFLSADNACHHSHDILPLIHDNIEPQMLLFLEDGILPTWYKDVWKNYKILYLIITTEWKRLMRHVERSRHLQRADTISIGPRWLKTP